MTGASLESEDQRLSALMRAALGGDETAYRRLLNALAASLRLTTRRGFARVGLGDADVEDVVQETLLAIHLKRRTWNPGEPLGPWVGAIARHKLVDSLRRRGRRVSIPIDDVAEVLQANDPAVDATGPEIDRLLAALSPRQAQVLRAITLDDMSIAQTARLHDMSPGAVRVALHRGLAALAAAYRNGRT